MNISYPTKKLFALIFFITFIIRASLFYMYIQHEERYRQPDTMDYHNCAIGLAFGTGMHRADNLKPIFWRTPGYPLLLAAAYKACHIDNSSFDKNHTAQKIFLWIQLAICSFTPIILFYLAFLLTSQLLIAYIIAIMAMLHPGFILASMYLLTEGFAIMLFYLFLLLFYYSFNAYGEHPQKRRYWILSIAGSALTLAAYTWMRPMGEFVAIVTAILIIMVSKESIQLKAKKSILFLCIFFSCLAPWYIRNYTLTGEWFFCPMSGAYLNSFIAPKIVRSLNNCSLDKAIGFCYYLAQQEAEEEEQKCIGTGYTVSRESMAKRIAWPIIMAYPLLAFKEWMQEVIKTTFDLYSYQLTTLIAGTFHYDPLEEFLSIKTKETLWLQPMPCWVRMIAWTEVAWMIWLWIGLFAGFWLFMLNPLIKRKTIQPITGLWIKTAPLIWAVIGMTGGFGYARLRLPIEPLMIILALTWWLHYRNTKKGILQEQNNCI